MTTTLRPAAFTRLADQLQITWNDGRLGTIAWTKLRAECPCAGCNEDRHRITKPLAEPTHTGLSLKVLQEKEVPRGSSTVLAGFQPVGNYAYKAVWSDGHDTGLYTYEFLHSLCEWKERS
ncbi:MAG: DUF971 domain-containing protein [Gemmatales bacterium]